jgi:hypothetical protein
MNLWSAAGTGAVHHQRYCAAWAASPTAYMLRGASSGMGQPIFSPETVFNFYPPSYQIPGTQTLAPEFGIDNAATALARANFINTVIMQSGAAPDPTVTGSTGTSISLTPLASTTNPALIAQLNQTLMHGSLPSDASNIILTAVNSVGERTRLIPLAPARTGQLPHVDFRPIPSGALI